MRVYSITLTIILGYLMSSSTYAQQGSALTLGLANNEPAQAQPTSPENLAAHHHNSSTTTVIANIDTSNGTHTNTTTEPTTDAVSIPKNPHDPNAPSLLESQAPTDSALSHANHELLSKNAELERRVDLLTTQNDVLVAERSGQLFLYGAITAIVAMFLGFVLARMFGRKERW